MKTVERGRQDWIIVLIILVIGLLCVIAAGQLALRLSPSWQMNTDMDSQLDPNSALLTRGPGGFVEALDPSILTQPSWLEVFLTPGASFVTRTPLPVVTRTPSPAPTSASSATSPAVATIIPTSTFIYFPATWTATSRPAPTTTDIVPTFPATATPAFTQTSTSLPSATFTPTTTPTNTPVPIPTDNLPPQIGTVPDGDTYNLPSGGTLTLGINLIANGDAGWDLVYYELPAGSGIYLDWVIVEISDGTNWYTVFNWGNNVADTNTNVDFNILSNPQVPPELDERDIPTAELYNGTGIAIDIDAIVPAGVYPYIRFTAPTGDMDGQIEIDAIEILPP